MERAKSWLGVWLWLRRLLLSQSMQSLSESALNREGKPVEGCLESLEPGGEAGDQGLLGQGWLTESWESEASCGLDVES